MAMANVRATGHGQPRPAFDDGHSPGSSARVPARFRRIFTVWTRSGPNGYIFAVNTGKRRSLEAAQSVA